MRLHRLLAAVGALGALGPSLAACSGPAEPAGTARAVALELRAADRKDAPPPPTVALGPGEVTVAGRLVTATPCYTVRAAARDEPGALTVALTATEEPGVCVQVLGAVAYTATVRGLAGGPRMLRVVYVHAAAGRTRTERALERDVTVP